MKCSVPKCVHTHIRTYIVAAWCLLHVCCGGLLFESLGVPLQSYFKWYCSFIGLFNASLDNESIPYLDSHGEQ